MKITNMIKVRAKSDKNEVHIHAKELCKYEQNTIINSITTSVLEAGEGYNLIVDVHKVSISDVQKRIKTIEMIGKLFYTLPEVTECYITNVSSTFQHIFALIKPIIKKESLKKIIIVPKKKENNYGQPGTISY